MTFKLVFMIAAAVLMVVGLPVLLVLVWMSPNRDKKGERRGGGGISSGVGAAMLELDRIVRPSAEHTIEVEETTLKREDDKGGE
jgi:hypothetical protein